MGIDLSLSERVRERKIQRERDGEGRESEGTTNTNRSLNCKHDLKETEAARFEPRPPVTAMSAPEFGVFTANDEDKMLVVTRHDVTARRGRRGGYAPDQRGRNLAYSTKKKKGASVWMAPEVQP